MREKWKGIICCLLLKGQLLGWEGNYILISFPKICEICMRPLAFSEFYFSGSVPEDHCMSIYTVFLFCLKKLSMMHFRKILSCILIHWLDSVLQLMYKNSRFEAQIVFFFFFPGSKEYALAKQTA